MTRNVKDHVIAALRSMMKPIILLMLRNGVTYREFALLCKSIFVESAAEDYGIRGRPANVSRIAVLTGIDRKEVKRIRDLMEDNRTAEDAQKTQDRFTRVLSAWYQNPEFTDAEGSPRILPVEGDSGSFAALARAYGGDVPVQALLRELVRVGVVEYVDDGVQVLSRYFFPAQVGPEALLRASSVIGELGEVLFHNLYVADPTKNGIRKKLRFERRATNNQISPKHRKAYYEFLEAEGQAFLERADAWLSDHEANTKNNDDASPEPLARLGVAVFCIDKPASNKDE